LHLTVAEQLEPLAAALAAVLADPPDDPFEPEWIAVPSAGMRRWLQLELARHLGASAPGVGDGVAANLISAFPGLLRLAVLEADLPDGTTDPWRPDRLTWAVLEVLAAGRDDPQLAPVAGPSAGGTAYGRARRIAELFDRYHLHRPDMVRLWAQDRDVDAGGEPVPAHHAWQPRLWRRLGPHLGLASPAERLPALLDRLRVGELVVDLPSRLVLFGVNNLPGGEGFVDVLDAVAATRDVHLFVVESSGVAGDAVRAHLPPRPSHGRRLRSDDATDGLVHHPLLRSWGRLHVETAALLADAAPRLGHPHVVPAPVELPTTLLGRLQAAIRADAVDGDLVPARLDRSVQFHACHGATRQVEVLRDVILHLLAADPTLSEDDVVVVCPALDRMAPTIEAVLGASADRAGSTGAPGVDAPSAPRLRYRIADRSVRTVNPLLAALSALLDLVAGRFEAPALLDALALPAVRERFRLDDDRLSEIAEWVDQTNVRWGLDAAHRAPFGVPEALTANTWRAGIDRLLVGAAVADDGAIGFGDLAPEGIEGDQLHAAGALAEVVWRLGLLAEQVDVARPLGDWVDLLTSAVDDLFAVPRDEAWQLDALRRLLGELRLASRRDGVDAAVDLTFADLRVALRDALAGAPGRPDFFRGGVTFSSLTPFRWVPHRVVCLLGLDQTALGAGASEGDDLLALAPAFGDRDPRAELRQSLLELVLAAREHLVVVRDGHDLKTNQPIPRATVVAELIDALVAVVRPDERERFAERLELHHPRQSFDQRNFVPGGLAGGMVWSFDTGSLAGAEARVRRSTTPVPFAAAPLPGDPPATVELGELHAAIARPIRTFVERRLGARFPRADDPARSVLPVAPSGLETWAIGDDLLDHLLGGGSAHEWEQLERRRGRIAPGVLGDRALGECTAEVEAMIEAASSRGVHLGSPERVPIDIVLDDGTRVVGTVDDRLGRPNPGPVRIQFTRPRPHHQLEAWLDLLVLTATDPSVRWRAISIHRSESTQKKGSPPTVCDVVVAGDTAEARRRVATAGLAVAVDLLRRSLTEPLPLFRHLSPALAEGTASPATWSGAAFRGYGGDLHDPEVALTYDGHDFASVIAIPRRDDDPAGPRSRAETYAQYLWGTAARSLEPFDEATT
jgi:exodeoxyribonuclease V gamma subunit